MTWFWTCASLICSALMYAAGRYDWGRFQRRRVEAAEASRYREETRALSLQLTRAERALADQGEIQHAAVVGPDLWPVNSAGYRSATHTDSPTRAGAGQPQQGVR